MNLEFFNCPEPVAFDAGLVSKALPEIPNYEINWQFLSDFLKDFQDFKQILILGHGGSITGLQGFYSALSSRATKPLYFLSTIDPDYIQHLKATLDPKETLVIAISKSGQTATLAEMLLQFLSYPLLFLTSDNSPLSEIAHKLSSSIFPHPPMGGRFTAFSEVLCLPAKLAGLNVEAFYASGKQTWQDFQNDNQAWKLASVVWQLEKQGKTEVFLPFYSHYLYFLNLLIVQLCHESFGKNGLGGSYLAFEAPESQHHTNQRFFGGNPNMFGLFLGVENFKNPLISSVPTTLKDIPFKDGKLSDFSNLALSQSMMFELTGTFEDAVLRGIPSIKLLLPEISESSLGKFIAFWQMYAIYSGLLRGVNPFDQPEVEASKLLSFSKRKSLK